MKINFGKYAGAEISELETSYIRWCLQNLSLRPELGEEMQAQLEAREDRKGIIRNVDHGVTAKMATPKGTKMFRVLADITVPYTSDLSNEDDTVITEVLFKYLGNNLDKLNVIKVELL